MGYEAHLLQKVNSAGRGKGMQLLLVTKHKFKTQNKQSLGMVPGKGDRSSGRKGVDVLASSLAVGFQEQPEPNSR